MRATFEHTEENAKGIFIMKFGDEVAANMTYSRINAHNIILDHTAVAPSMKGKGVGKQIVQHMVDWARENNQKVLPLCPFAKSVIERNPEMQDILRK
ncbi:MAG: N-acetyltransferase [Salibacteraceae bacterium]|jgi:uncharacterized protein|nr:N-acetyltransferase [Salibacteraceae bacterium]MDP4687333.1 N-acetyltransferase [Salibacteraceae bacterium]MDP4762810.1 N-acetyltransferase [Salibacteraceae bacterium]MDP4965560.1 N-acetyltransferase [Salibacteraceae bacterium]